LFACCLVLAALSPIPCVAYPYLEYLESRVELAGDGKVEAGREPVRLLLAALLPNQQDQAAAYADLLLEQDKAKVTAWYDMAVAAPQGEARAFEDLQMAFLAKIWAERAEPPPARDELLAQFDHLFLFHVRRSGIPANQSRRLVFLRKAQPDFEYLMRELAGVLTAVAAPVALEKERADFLRKGAAGSWTPEELATARARYLELVSATDIRWPTEPALHLEAMILGHLCMIRHPAPEDYLSAVEATKMGDAFSQSACQVAPTDSAFVQRWIARLEPLRDDLSESGRERASLLVNFVAIPHRRDPAVQAFLRRCVEESFGAYQADAPMLVSFLNSAGPPKDWEAPIDQWANELKAAADHLPKAE
jgi:hypothetical protein